jgi:hypothetical protein
VSIVLQDMSKKTVNALRVTVLALKIVNNANLEIILRMGNALLVQRYKDAKLVRNRTRLFVIYAIQDSISINF